MIRFFAIQLIFFVSICQLSAQDVNFLGEKIRLIANELVDQIAGEKYPELASNEPNRLSPVSKVSILPFEYNGISEEKILSVFVQEKLKTHITIIANHRPDILILEDSLTRERVFEEYLRSQNSYADTTYSTSQLKGIIKIANFFVEGKLLNFGNQSILNIKITDISMQYVGGCELIISKEKESSDYVENQLLNGYIFQLNQGISSRKTISFRLKIENIRLLSRKKGLEVMNETVIVDPKDKLCVIKNIRLPVVNQSFSKMQSIARTSLLPIIFMIRIGEGGTKSLWLDFSPKRHRIRTGSKMLLYTNSGQITFNNLR